MPPGTRYARSGARALVIAPAAPGLRVLDCDVDTMRRLVTRGEGAEPVRITVKAMQVLLVLVAGRGAVVSREALLERVWPDTMPTDDVVTQAIAQLRKAFGDDRDAPRYIETIAKAGYRLVAPVQWLQAPDDAASREHPQVADHPPGRPAAGAAPASRPNAAGTGAGMQPAPRPVLWLALAALVLLVLLVVVSVGSPADPAPAAGPVAGETDILLQALSYRAITSTPGQERMPALSPDGATVAFSRTGAEGEGSPLMLQPVGEAAARVLTAPAPGHSDVMPAWSPDGSRVAFVRLSSGDCRIMLVAAGGGEATQAGACLEGAYSPFDWTPDGRALVMGGLRAADDASAALRALDLGSGRWRRLEYDIADGDVDLMPRHSPDGRWLGFRRNTSLGDLWLMPAGGGAPKRLTTLRGDIRGWDWLPDGSGLVFSHVTAGASLYAYRLADGVITPLSPLAGSNAVHPDLAARAWSMVFEIDQSRSGLFRTRLDGAGEAEPEPVFASSGVDVLPAVSPDGGMLAFISDRTMSVQLWLGEVGNEASLRAVEGLRPVPRHPPVWSDDGASLLVLGRTGGSDALFEVQVRSGRVQRLAIPAATPVFAAYAGGPERLLVGVDGGQGRVRLVLYARDGWRELASLDDVALARYDGIGDTVYFTRQSRAGLWRADAGLRGAAQVSATHPAPHHYRHWGLIAGRPFYAGPAGDCGTSWRELLDTRVHGRCVSREGVAIAGSPSVDAGGRWLYLGLPMAQNIDIGWTMLPARPYGPR